MLHQRRCTDCDRHARALDIECHECGGSVTGAHELTGGIASAGGVGLWCLDAVLADVFAALMVDDLIASAAGA